MASVSATIKTIVYHFEKPPGAYPQRLMKESYALP